LSKDNPLSSKLKTIPNKPGVYLFKDRLGAVIYIGKAKALHKRVASYFRPQHDIKTSLLVAKIRDIDYILTASELDALVLENELIKKYDPKYNIDLKDDKAYPYVKVTVNEAWPRVILARRKEKDGALYYGRYKGAMVQAIISLIKRLFPVRWCKETPLKMRQQPCLYYHLGSCAAPCIGNISQPQYNSLIEGIKLLLSGKLSEAKGQLKKEMDEAAREQDYERAVYFRNSLGLLEKIIEGEATLKHQPSPAGISELVELKDDLGLLASPMRIECFDISNISSSNIVASMVTFFGGAPLKKAYRRFIIRTVIGKPNDVQAIYEVVKRRYAKTLTQKLPWPDLVMVDGGAPQVSLAKKALEAAGRGGLPLIGLAKKEEEIYLPGRTRTIKLAKHSKALQLLQRIRDEAHRFAITYQRTKGRQALFR